MLGVPYVLLCACALALGQRLDLYEGDICKQVRGTTWTCKALKDCPRAQQRMKQGRTPQMCNMAGTESVVCCQPEATQKSGIKAKEMCKKYGESVYIYIEDPVSDGLIKIDQCALVEPLVLHGKNAESREYPHMALIGYGKKDSIIWGCGGSLISERFVLSAAHCTRPDNGSVGLASWVRLGDYNKDSTDDEENGLSSPREYEIIERFDHPEYQSTKLYHDITLYKLNTDVEFTDYIRPICLQTEHQFAKTYAIITGWGVTQFRGQKSSILQKGNVTIIERKQCSDTFRGKSKALDKGIIDASQLCAGDIHTRVDTCQGDSGGPLQQRLADPFCMYSQVGITSFGVECGSPYPGVYTRVSYYVPWIEKIVWP